MLIEPKKRIALKWKNVRKSLISGAIIEAWRQLRRIKKSAESPWSRSPREDHLRGIDFYAPSQLKWIMATAMRDYRRAHGHYPDIQNPKTYNEKIFWFKFFGEIKNGLTGNKLRTSELLPESLRSEIRAPRVVWHSPKAKLPENDTIPPGYYYFKVSHGSGMFQRVQYPLTAKEKSELQAKGQSWLNSEYGLKKGEWWYSTFDPELLLEEDVCKEAGSISWHFTVLNGTIAMITLRIKFPSNEGTLIRLDPDFKPMKSESGSLSEFVTEMPACKDQMTEAALEIGKQLNAVRVDFLVGADGQPYIGELTFAPGDALTQRHPDLELMLGTHWSILR